MRRDEGGSVCGGERLERHHDECRSPRGTGDYVMVAWHTLGSAL